MLYQGPLEHMDDVELQHWMNVAACRAVAAATQALQHLLDAAAERVAPADQPLQARRHSMSVVELVFSRVCRTLALLACRHCVTSCRQHAERLK